MPWKVFKQEQKFVVRKLNAEGEPTGDPLGTHDTEAEATAQQRALYAAENSKAAVKFADMAETEIEGLGMPWGGNFNGQDLAGEHFSAKTDFAFDWFPADARPLLYHHGLDKDAGASVVGRVKGYEVKADLGVWTKAQLDASSEYFAAIKDLIKAGKLFFSSGSMRHLVDVAKSGEINRWPWVELSLTPTPCNLYAELDFASAEKHYEAAGIKADLSALKLASSDLPANEDLPDEDAEVIEKLEEYIAALTSLSDDEIEKMDSDKLDACLEMIAELSADSTKAGGHSGHGGQHSGHGSGGMGPIAKRGAKKRVMGALETKRDAVMTDLANVRKMKLTSPGGEALRRDVIKGAQTELAGVRKKMLAARAKYKSYKAILDTPAREELEDADYAYIDSEGGRHLPMHDAVHARNALARFDQTTFESGAAKEKARKKLWTRAKELGIEVSDEGKSASIKALSGSYEHLMECLSGLINPYNPFGKSDCWAYVEATFSDHFIAKQHADGECCYWRVEYTVGEDGCPRLGKMEQVEETYVPKAEMAGMDMPMSDHAEMTKAFAAGLVERTKDLRERRIKEGRIISTSNRRKLGECLTGMRAACDEMQALLDSTEPQPAKAASVRQHIALLSLYNATLNN